MNFMYETHPAFVRGKHYCNLCNTHFLTKSDRDFHLIETHNIVPCDICDYCFPSVPQYKVHLKDAHSLNCSICNTKLFDDQQLHEHMDNFHSVKCGQCDERFATDELRETHCRARHLPLVVPQPLLSTVSNETGIVSNVNPIRRLVNLYPCQMCNLMFLSLDLRDTHIDTVHRLRYLTEFAAKNNAHRLTAHPDPLINIEKQIDKNTVKVRYALKCELCKKLFSTETLLRSHYCHVKGQAIYIKKEKKDVKKEEITFKTEPIEIKKEDIFIKKEKNN